MLKVTNLKKKFASPGNTVTAVDDVSFSVPEGMFAAVIGKSGSGKSTLLSLLGTLDEPTSGSIEVDGHELTKMSGRKMTGYRRDTIGFVFQFYNLIPNLTAIKNVMLPMEFARIGRAERRERAMKLLERVGITGDTLRRKPGRLSGGEQQRVAIARALANHPKLLLADEPTGNLDSDTGKLIVNLLHDLAKTENVAVIAVTHDDGIASQADQTFRIKDGKLI